MKKNYSLKPGWKQKNPAMQRVAKIGPPTRFWGLASRLEYRTKIRNKKNK